ncbi:hypothetical protein NDU88_010742 [Pleurodeles waltl]|uniref:Uncharacterized protein n=1 Tax=Pleurodeles waltl TaxID=8319 RepID=A0AAV7PYX5_PLEWA|nr:hypothetical protein NDU88_010742 [Pleurodeles waltl]
MGLPSPVPIVSFTACEAVSFVSLKGPTRSARPLHFGIPQDAFCCTLDSERMAGYDDQAEDLYYMDDASGSFDQDLVYALDAGVRHSVNQALAQAIQPIKHHLLGLVDQQAWAAPVSAPTMGDSSFAANPQPAKQTSYPHSADFQSLIRNMAREHDYKSGSQKKAMEDPASSSSSSEHSSEQEDAPPRKRKKKAHHQEVPTPKVMMRSNAICHNFVLLPVKWDASSSVLRDFVCKFLVKTLIFSVATFGF